MKAGGLGVDDLGFLRASQRPAYEVGRDAVRVVDLFCGCGGMTLGVAEAARAQGRSLDIRLAIEVNPRIYSIYRANFTPAIDLGAQDVAAVIGEPGGRRTKTNNDVIEKVGEIDLLVGGPPCQGHSNLNNYTRGHDPKNALYLAMVRAASLFRPSHVIIENVPSVLRATEGVVDRASDRLSKLGYSVDDAVIALAQLGVPQLRKRHVLVASLSEPLSVAGLLAYQALTNTRDLRWAIGDLAETRATAERDFPSVLSADNQRRVQWMLAKDRYDLPNRMRPACHRDKPNHRYKSMYGRLRWDLPAQTITSGFMSPGQGRYLHPAAPRTITPHEAARIQFFPDWFDFSSAPERSVVAESIGNAVPPKLTYVLADGLLGRTMYDAKQRAG